MPVATSSFLFLVVRMLLVAMPGAPSSFLFLVVRPGAPSSVLAPSSFLLNGLGALTSLHQSVPSFLAVSPRSHLTGIYLERVPIDGSSSTAQMGT